MGISMSELSPGAIAEGGMIVVGTIASIIGPNVALARLTTTPLETREHFQRILFVLCFGRPG
jgi:hypothetical protein